MQFRSIRRSIGETHYLYHKLYLRYALLVRCMCVCLTRARVSRVSSVRNTRVYDSVIDAHASSAVSAAGCVVQYHFIYLWHHRALTIYTLTYTH